MSKRNSKKHEEKTKVAKWRKDVKAIDKFKFIHHFLPHPEKKERAKFLSFKSFGIYIFLIVFLMGLFRILPTLLPGVLGYASNINVTDLLTDTNQMREKDRLEPLVFNEALSKAAYQKAMDMFEDDYWSHVAPDGKEPWDFILAENYDYTYAGENLAKNFSASSDVVKAWMESPSHRENLLNRNYKEVGFAVVNGTLGGIETTLVVQMFGQPRDLTMITSKESENKALKEISTQAVSTVNTKVLPQVLPETKVVPINVDNISTYVSLTLLGFILGLFALDMWYSSRHQIIKLTGHTFAHFVVLLVVLVGVWFVLKPGIVL